MSTETRFLFETDFGNSELSESGVRLYSEDDIQAAKAEASQLAQAEMRSFEEQRAADLLAEMSAKLDTLSAQRTEDLQSATESAVGVAVAMCRKALPTLAAQNALSEIAGHVTRTLADVHGEPRVVVRVAEENLAALQARIDEIAAGFDGKIVLLVDDQLALTDCHVMWADGGSERDVQRTWSEIDKAVALISEISDSSVTAEIATEVAHDSIADTQELPIDISELEQLSQAID